MFSRFLGTCYAIILCTLVPLLADAQTVTIGAVDAGPYGSGSTVVVPFTIKLDVGEATFAQTNRFELYLSDANGDFTAQTKIGEYIGFYTSFLNGVIPTGLPDGDGYRLRIVSTNPVQTYLVSTAIKLRSSSGPVAGVSNNNVLNAETFGWCGASVGTKATVIFTNTSTAGASVSFKYKDEL